MSIDNLTPEEWDQAIDSLANVFVVVFIAANIVAVDDIFYI